MSAPIPFQLFYNEETDQLAIGRSDWEYLCLVKFVPFVKQVFTYDELVIRYKDPVSYVEHEIAEPKTAAWVAIGEF